MKLEKVQHHAARFVHNNYWPIASVTEMICDLNWESMEIHRQNAHLCMLFKAINGLIKIPMDHYHSSIYTSTRSFHGQNLLLPNCRTNTYKHSFFPATIQLWNSLPREAIESNSLNTFKLRIYQLNYKLLTI